jgi:hypothetical protein
LRQLVDDDARVALANLATVSALVQVLTQLAILVAAELSNGSQRA